MSLIKEYVVGEIYYFRGGLHKQYLSYKNSWSFFDKLEEAYPNDSTIVFRYLLDGGDVVTYKNNTKIRYIRITKEIDNYE